MILSSSIPFPDIHKYTFVCSGSNCQPPDDNKERRFNGLKLSCWKVNKEKLSFYTNSLFIIICFRLGIGFKYQYEFEISL